MLDSLGEHKDVVADWQTVVIGPHMWVVRSKDAGGKFKKQGVNIYTKEKIIKFVKALLHYCLIPPLAIKGVLEDVIHGDLRPANVTSELKIIDFEFLGFTGTRLEQSAVETDKHYEITDEQRLGATTFRTNVWQVGLLISHLFFAALPDDDLVTIHAIASASPAVDSNILEEPLRKFLERLRKVMVTEPIWQGAKSADPRPALRDLLDELDKL